MTSMYSQNDYDKIKKTLFTRRLLIYSVFFAMLIAGIVLFIISLVDWHAYLHTEENGLAGHIKTYPFAFILPLCAGFFGIFFISLYIGPVAKYKKYLDDAFFGRSHEKHLIFKQMDDKTVEREGIQVYPMILSEGDPKNEKDDRLLYMDARVEHPSWQCGDRLLVTVHDRFLIDWKSEEDERRNA